jgi:hypothetical protein
MFGGIGYPLGIMPTIFNPPYTMTKTAIMIPILRKFSGVIIGVLKLKVGVEYQSNNTTIPMNTDHTTMAVMVMNQRFITQYASTYTATMM